MPEIEENPSFDCSRTHWPLPSDPAEVEAFRKALRAANQVVLQSRAWPESPCRERVYRIAQQMADDLAFMGYRIGHLEIVQKAAQWITPTATPGETLRQSTEPRYQFPSYGFKFLTKPERCPAVAFSEWRLRFDADGNKGITNGVQKSGVIVAYRSNVYQFGAFEYEPVPVDAPENPHGVPGLAIVPLFETPLYCGLPTRKSMYGDADEP